MIGCGNWRCAMVLLAVGLANGQMTWDQLDEEVERLYTAGDPQGAIAMAQRAVAAAVKPQQKGLSLSRLGFLTTTFGDPKQGEVYLRQAMEIQIAAGKETADYSTTALNLAMLLRDTGRGAEAIPLAKEGVDIRTRILGEKALLTAAAVTILASIHHVLGDYEEAKRAYEQALGIHGGQSSLVPEYGTLCTQAAQLYQRLGDYTKASALFEKALEVAVVTPGKAHPVYSVTLLMHAVLLRELGDYRRAERLFAEAVPLVRSQFPEGHVNVAKALNNQGLLYLSMGNLSAAEVNFRESVRLQRANNQPLSIASALSNLGRTVNRRDPAEGKRLLKEALDQLETIPKPPAFELAQLLTTYGGALAQNGDLAEAETTIRRALELIERTFGKLHRLYPVASGELGQILRQQGKRGEAEKLFEAAIESVEKNKGAEHRDLMPPLERLAHLRREAGDYASAYRLLHRVVIIQQTLALQAMGMGSEAAKAEMISNVRDPIPELIDLQERGGDVTTQARTLAFEAVTSRKARLLEYVRDWRETVRRGADEPTRKLLNEWQALINCRAALNVALGYRDMPGPVGGTCSLTGGDFASGYDRLAHELRASWSAARSQKAQEAIAAVTARLSGLEETLSRDAPRMRGILKPIAAREIQARLAPDELLLEFVTYKPLSANSSADHYAVFLVTKEGAIEWVDLGVATDIDRAVRDVLRSADDWAASLSSRHGSAAETAKRTAIGAMQLLSSRLLLPIAARLPAESPIRRLRVAPDGMLTLLPFEALSHNGRDLLDRFEVSYLRAGRDLLESDRDSAVGNASLIAVSAGPGRSLRGSPPQSVFRTEKLEALPGAREEGRRVKRYLPTARVLGDGEATEDALKQVDSPAVAHIVGHGIIRGARSGNEDVAMSLSAIVLEEVYGRGRGSVQDGLLTASEMQNLNLSKSQLLVLSQCRMADGAPSTSEGVYGMRRAAALAGVRSFMAPLWKIEDGAQLKIIDTFYGGLGAGESRSAALRKAKLRLRADKARSHFFYWAPLILAGDAGVLPAGLVRPPAKAKVQ